jgi:hypothetical protein
LFPIGLFAQDISSAIPNYLQGFQKRVEGNTIIYNSPQPEVENALLGRARTEFKTISWESQAIPKAIEGEFISFIWIFGIDVNVESHPWHLLVNDKKYLTFYNPKNNDLKSWTVDGIRGSQLHFRRTMIDRHGDAFGYATLKLPAEAVKGFEGEPLLFSVLSEEAGSNVWYMTFMSAINERFEIMQEQTVLKENGKRYNRVKLEAVYLGENTTAHITIPGIADLNLELLTGFNSVGINIPVVSQKTEFDATVTIKDRTYNRRFSVEPVKDWKIYFVQHTHTDIGYTRPQTEILPEHLRFIDYALDYCDLTDTFSDDAKFRWTCEAAWAVKEYLNTRPATQIERLKKRIAEGRIEVTGMYFNMSEIIDETTLAALTQTLSLFDKNGIPVQTAMQDDVNGIGWCMADYFPDAGVKYLIMGEHGHRARIPFDIPTVFWWESPSGSRMLAFRGEHYMFGNSLGVHTGNIETFGNSVMKYLTSLESKGYPFREIGLQYSGYVTDNSPPALSACELVNQWNELYETPRLRMATAGEFMKYAEANYGNEIPVYRKAWPDWWTDGTGTAARETDAVRQSQNDMIANECLFALTTLSGEKMKSGTFEKIKEAQEAIAFYDEHTFGAAESIYDPWSENSMVQWGEKGSYAWEAVKKTKMLREEGMGMIQDHIPRSEYPTIAVLNTLNWQRSGLITVYIDHEMLSGTRNFQIMDEQGNLAEAQQVGSREDGSYWGIWVENVPAAGFKTYRVIESSESRTLPKKIDFKGIFENEFYRIAVNTEKGTVQSLFDKKLNMELIDEKCHWQLAEVIYEQLDNRTQLERFTNSRMDTTFKGLAGSRTTMKNIRVEGSVDGPVWKSILIHGELPVCADERGITCEIRLYKKEKRIEFIYELVKLPVTTAEAVYVAFPFSLPGSNLLFEAQGGIVVPGKDQLEGTSSDWNTIQSFAAVKGKDSQIVFCSPEMPLVQFGDINTGKFDYISDPKHPWIFSWPFNNFWTTNFRASQEGEHKWSYRITSGEDTTRSFATRFGWSNRVPMLTRVQPAGKSGIPMKPVSYLNLDIPGLLLVSMKSAEDDNGIILHLREVNGKALSINAESIINNVKAKSISEVSIIGKEIQPIEKEITFKPCEVKFLRIRF